MTRTPQTLEALVKQYLSFAIDLSTEIMKLNEIPEGEITRVQNEHNLMVRRIVEDPIIPDSFKQDVQEICPPKLKLSVPRTKYEWADALRYLGLGSISTHGKKLGRDARIKDELREYQTQIRHILHHIETYKIPNNPNQEIESTR